MGLDRNKVKLEEYNEKWKEDFDKEKILLKNIFKEDAIDIQHVGSTAIPGIKAKPIIDIAIAVKELDIALKHKEELEKEGYVFRGDAGVKGRYFFSKGTDENKTHHIHVETIDSPNWENHVLFKNYLIKHPEEIKQYEKVKLELAEKYKDERKK